jgi:hypothetical protein
MPQIEGVDADIDIVDDRLELRYRGDYVLGASLKLLEQAFETAARRDLTRILVDVRDLVGNPTVSDRYDIGTFVATRCAERHFGIRIAFVGEEPLIDPARFGELVVRNRFAKGRVFSELHDALEWLSEAGDR